MNFPVSKSNGPNSLILSSTNFYCKDTIFRLNNVEIVGAYEACSETFIENQSLQNWGYNQQPPEVKTQIKIHYRLTNFAPIDTFSYKYNYRQGNWKGPHKDAKEVTVNYDNDKKNGIASALYSDGDSYVVNFRNNIADNYGQGIWKHNNGTKKIKFQYLIPNILGTCKSNNLNNYTSFDFLRSKKSHEVTKHDDISVHFEKKGMQHDSLQYHVRGSFMTIANDSMVIQTEEINVHDFYRKNTDSLHSFSKKLSTGFAIVPMKDIYKIYYTRSEWKTFTLRTTLVSLATAFIVSPLISIQKGGFNYDRFNKVSSVSLGVAVLSVSFGIAFSQKQFLIKPTTKSNNTWTIKPENN
ncbi:MAG: hypothetical protein IPH32_17175 [Bacteroidetes bacterium]|nr:hypothetical protein [Bacteroidota bacterium]